MGNVQSEEKKKCDKLEIYVEIFRNSFEIMYKYNEVLEPYSGELNYKHETLEISAVYKAIERIEYLPFTFTEIVCYVPKSLLSKCKFENIIFKSNENIKY